MLDHEVKTNPRYIYAGTKSQMIDKKDYEYILQILKEKGGNHEDLIRKIEDIIIRQS